MLRTLCVDTAGLSRVPAGRARFDIRRLATLAAMSLIISLHCPRLSRAEDDTQAAGESHPLVAEVDSIAMIVADADLASEFYSKVLSFETVSDQEVAGVEYERLYGLFGLRLRLVRMRLGEEAITLIEFLVPRGRALPTDARNNDRAFQHIAIVTADMDAAYRRLRKHKVQHASTGPQRLPDWNPKAGGIQAFYFKDLDGHPLEILEFPPGKGDPKWHSAKDKLFLGIDHTAIVVADTDTSLLYYRDLFGLRVVGESENYGTEQEHLNHVFGARLRITTLRPAQGPGIELLEYLSPRDGRHLSPDARPNDLVRTQVRLVVHESTKSDTIETRLRGAKAGWISPGLIRFHIPEPAGSAGLTLQDPDGHILQFIAR